MTLKAYTQIYDNRLIVNQHDEDWVLDYQRSDSEALNGWRDAVPNVAAPAAQSGQLACKTHRALVVLANLEPEDTRDITQIAHESGVGRRSLSRILSRLFTTGRISRSKGLRGPNGYFRYWLNEEQREHFRALRDYELAKAGTLVSEARKSRPYRRSLNKVLEEFKRLATLEGSFEQERTALQRRLEALREQVRLGSKELTQLRTKIKDKERSAERVERDLRIYRNRHNQAHDRLELAGSMFRNTPTELSARLAFIRKLRERPALADLAELKKVEEDYVSALDYARGES